MISSHGLVITSCFLNSRHLGSPLDLSISPKQEKRASKLQNTFRYDLEVIKTSNETQTLCNNAKKAVLLLFSCLEVLL